MLTLLCKHGKPQPLVSLFFLGDALYLHSVSRKMTRYRFFNKNYVKFLSACVSRKIRMVICLNFQVTYLGQHSQTPPLVRLFRVHIDSMKRKNNAISGIRTKKPPYHKGWLFRFRVCKLKSISCYQQKHLHILFTALVWINIFLRRALLQNNRCRIQDDRFLVQMELLLRFHSLRMLL